MRRKQRDIQVERLEFEVRNLRSQIDRMRQDPGDLPFNGCCDHGCDVKRRDGVGTNGGCCCDENTLKTAVRWYRRRCEFLQATIQEMRDGKPEESLRQTAEYFIKETDPPLPTA